MRIPPQPHLRHSTLTQRPLQNKLPHLITRLHVPYPYKWSNGLLYHG